MTLDTSLLTSCQMFQKENFYGQSGGPVMLCSAVAIASNEIVGGTKTNDALRQAFEELRRLSKRDLED